MLQPTRLTLPWERTKGANQRPGGNPVAIRALFHLRFRPISLKRLRGRRGRVAEGGGLLNRYTSSRRIEGSNPSVSARQYAESIDCKAAVKGHEPVQQAVIYGAGGHARELLFQLLEANVPVVALVDDFQPNRSVHRIPVRDFADALSRHGHAAWHVAIGDIPAREKILQKLRSAGVVLGGFVSRNSIIAPSSAIADSVQIFAGTVVSDACEIGANVILNFGCIVSHNVKIGGSSIVAPRAAIAGNVEIAEQVWIGVGATVKNGTSSNPLRIGRRAVIGAGACVVGDVGPDTTVIGVPARPIGDQAQ